MIEFYRDAGGTIGYNLYLRDGELVLTGDGNSDEDEILEFFAKVQVALEDQKVVRKYNDDENDIVDEEDDTSV